MPNDTAVAGACIIEQNALFCCLFILTMCKKEFLVRKMNYSISKTVAVVTFTNIFHVDLFMDIEIDVFQLHLIIQISKN